MPALVASTATRVMPSSALAPFFVRTATSMKSATWASRTNSFVPLSTSLSPSTFASICTPSASKRAEGSVIASVQISSPEAIFGRCSFFWASVPQPISGIAPPTCVDRKGPGTRARPNSSVRMTRSRKSHSAAALFRRDDQALPALVGHLLPERGRVALLVLFHLADERFRCTPSQGSRGRSSSAVLVLRKDPGPFFAPFPFCGSMQAVDSCYSFPLRRSPASRTERRCRNCRYMCRTPSSR